jgi:hypothetical protein
MVTAAIRAAGGRDLSAAVAAVSVISAATVRDALTGVVVYRHLIDIVGNDKSGT